MVGKHTKSITVLLFVFISGCFFIIFTESLIQMYYGANQKQAYKVVDCALKKKLEEDSSFKQLFSNNGLEDIMKNWPSNANSFYVIIEDHFGSSFEGKVFFDTGDMFSFATSKGRDGKIILDSFEKLKWPHSEEKY